MASLPYRPEIDGLRAIAVLAVIAFHLREDWIPGGFLGVDVFFVISGYLITSIARHELETRAFSFRHFWARRIRRILPAMLLMTLVTGILSLRYSFPGDRSKLGLQALSALCSASNVVFWRTAGDYWGSDASTSPFLNLWSLSVEEQFYFLHPFLLYGVYRFTVRPRRWIRVSLFVILILSASLFLLGARTAPSATFYLLPARAWELAAGCWIAYLPPSTKPLKNLANLSQLLGLTIVATAFAYVDGIGLGVVPAVLGCAMLVWPIHARGCGNGAVSKILASPVAVLIGRMSYSLYLWHWPIAVFAFNIDPAQSPSTLLVVVTATSLAAFLSFRYVETPARRSKMPLSIILVGFIVVFLAAMTMACIPSSVIDVSGWQRTHWFGRYYDLSPSGTIDSDFQRLAITMDVPARTASADAFRNGGILVGAHDGPPDVVLLGDSHGVMWSDAVRQTSLKLNLKSALISMNGVLPFFQVLAVERRNPRGLTHFQQAAYDQSRMDLIREWKPKVAIVACRWSAVSEEECLPTLRFLQEHCRCVLLIEQPPELSQIGNRNALEFAVWNQLRPDDSSRLFWPTGNRKRVASGRNLLRRLAAMLPRCAIIPVHDLYIDDSHFGDEHRALLAEFRHAAYIDDDHLSTYGSHLAIPLFEAALAKAMDATDASAKASWPQ